MVGLGNTARISVVGNNAWNAYAKEHLEQQFPKIDQYEEICHKTLEALAGEPPAYGTVIQIMRKTIGENVQSVGIVILLAANLFVANLFVAN